MSNGRLGTSPATKMFDLASVMLHFHYPIKMTSMHVQIGPNQGIMQYRFKHLDRMMLAISPAILYDHVDRLSCCIHLIYHQFVSFYVQFVDNYNHN